MKRLFTLSLLTALLCSSCGMVGKFFKDKLTVSWKFTHMDGTTDSENDTTSHEWGMLNKRFHNGYLRLYDDYKYTFVGENISAMHSWSRSKSDSTMVLDSFIGSKALHLKIVEIGDEWLKLNVTGIGSTALDGRRNTLLFGNDPSFEYANIDLLNYPLNSWRIKPTHKESQAEILKRVKAHVDFLIAYYQMIEDDNRSSFAPMYLQSIFGFYQNGIAIDNDAYLQYKWQSCFYDEDDAKAGQQILVEALNGMGQYPDAKNFTEGYLKALKKMKEFLSKIS